MIDWPTTLTQLAAPFSPDLIRYRAGATSKDNRKAQALPYVEPRAYEDRLNQIVPGLWHVEFEPWGETRLICRLTINHVTRSSTGESSGSPKEIAGTSAEAQAFKRACSKFGLGRYLYDLPITWTTYDPDKRTITKPTPPAAPIVETGKDAKPTANAAIPTDRIGQRRAAHMHNELAQLGLDRANHKQYASSILGKVIPRLAELTEDEARRVWKAACRGDEADASLLPTRHALGVQASC